MDITITKPTEAPVAPTATTVAPTATTTTESTTPTTPTTTDAPKVLSLNDAPPKGTPEYEEFILAYAEQTQRQQDALTRPQWLPEKFKSPEDMAKAYAELEKKLHGGKKDEATPTTPEATTDSKTTEGQPQGGIEFTKYSTELVEKGTLSEDSYKELETKGMSKELVDSYIEGQNALKELATLRQEQSTREIKSLVGSEQDWIAATSWAATNWTEEQLNTFNEAVTKDVASAKLAVQNLKFSYLQANGSEPVTVVEGGSTSTPAPGFASKAEMIKAVNDPRYKNDPAYRASVEAKVMQSDF